MTEPLSFRAAVLPAPGSRQSVATLQCDPPGPGEVLVRMGAASLCHTDLEVIEGQLAYPTPIILGHEGAGTIEAVGAAVDPTRIGDHVVLSWNPHCGHCFHCSRGQPILCETYTALGPKAVPFSGQTRFSLDSQPVHTMMYLSAFAEYAVVTAGCAVTVPKEIPFDRACLLGCGVLTGVGGAIRIGGVRWGDTVAVIGCGAVGLSAVQGAVLAGAGAVVAIDLDEGKLAIARVLGATHTVNARTDDPLSALRDLTAGRGADVVLEAAGHPDAFRLSPEICRTGGQIVWLGKVGIGQDVAFRWGSLMGEKRITRSSYGGAQTGTDFPMLARAYLQGRLKLDEMITRRIRLENINEGFNDLREGRAIRSVIMFPG